MESPSTVVWGKLFIFAPLILLVCSCARKGEVTQMEHFAQYAGHGRATYYRCVISGFGKNGKVQYRSGWFDAAAVDDLFGVVGDRNRVNAITAERQNLAVKRTYSSYMEALENKDLADEIPARRERYKEVLESITGTTSLGESPVLALNHANQKFVVILANDPDAIIQAIRNRVKSGQITHSIGLMLKGQTAQGDLEGQLKLRLLAARLKGLKESLATSRDALPENATAAGLELAIREILTEVEPLQ